MKGGICARARVLSSRVGQTDIEISEDKKLWIFGASTACCEERAFSSVPSHEVAIGRRPVIRTAQQMARRSLGTSTASAGEPPLLAEKRASSHWPERPHVHAAAPGDGTPPLTLH
ncbi:hypothetical protein AcV5_008607 [Taiwanofungus camphoratus]|nr:hypothetical protein AcV5_008607 [Antrodia cinnamomea]